VNRCVGQWAEQGAVCSASRFASKDVCESTTTSCTAAIEEEPCSNIYSRIAQWPSDCTAFWTQFPATVVGVQGGQTASGAAACAPPYAQGSCPSYQQGQVVSVDGENWVCASVNCRNCATFTGCQPGQTGCPWGAVWIDDGQCY
jgi:hypothetical protein